MKLIVDSGSTKAKWAFIDNATVTYLDTEGINPHFATKKDIELILKKIENYSKKPIEEIYFYGSGVTTKLLADELENQLRIIVNTNARIIIETDLFAACRALFGNKKGVVCILGTGAATCFFDGKHVIDSVPSLGFWLGDEGSGADLGKRLIKAYLRKELSAEILESFEKEYGSFDRAFVFDKIKNDSMPNAFFASFCPFLKKNESNSDIKALLENAFDEFIKHHLVSYKVEDYIKIGFVGSIAFYFGSILRKRLSMFFDNDIIIISNPIEALVKYHVTNVQ